jgi:signal transduction histidine kinase
MAEQLGVPEYIAYNLFPVIKKVNMMLLVGLPPIFILLLLWGIILSHRLAGPIERIEKDIKDILSKRDYEKRIVLRKHDDLKPLSNTINRLVERLNEK